MNKQKLINQFITSTLLFSAVVAHGAGFALYEGTAAGNVDTAGVIAKGGEAGAIFFNPAAITDLEGTQVQGGVSFVVPQCAVEGTDPYTGKHYKKFAKKSFFPLPHLYLTHKLNDSLSLGLGLYTRYGLGANFGQSWFGRYNSTEVSIVTFNVTPTLAWKVNDWMSLSLGLSAQYLDVDLQQNIDAVGGLGMRNYNSASYTPYDVHQTLEGENIGLGFDIGLQLKPTDKWNIGLAYHSRVKHDIDGKVSYNRHPMLVQMAPMLFNNTDAKCELTLPDQIMFASSYDVTDNLTLGGGFIYTMWETYDELDIKLARPIMPNKNSLYSDKDWKNVWRIFAGGSYKLTDSFTVRASYTYDQSPLNENHIDYLVPADTRHLVALGCGWTKGAWTYDLGYFYEIIPSKDVNARPKDGVYNGRFTDANAHCFSFSISKKF